MLRIINISPNTTNSQQNLSFPHTLGLDTVGPVLSTIANRPTLMLHLLLVLVLVLHELLDQMLVVLVSCWLALANMINHTLTGLLEYLLAVGSFIENRNGRRNGN